MLCPILLQAAIKRPRATKVEIGGERSRRTASKKGNRRSENALGFNDWTVTLTLVSKL